MKKLLIFSIIVLLILTLSACGDSNLTMEKFEKIENGMSYNEVKDILGEGKLEAETKDESLGLEIKSYIWEDGQKVITVMFQNDKVNTKAQAGL